MAAIVGAPREKGQSDREYRLFAIGMAARATFRIMGGVDDDADVLDFPQAPEAIELRHLRAFVAVAEELNFGRAADRLHITQSALSRQIRSLEQLMGCELLRRSTHRAELTIAGEALLDRTRPVLREVDAAVSAAQSVGGELEGRVARHWAPVIQALADEADIQEWRAAYEEMHAQFDPPPEIQVRPANANGVPSLVVATEPDQPPTLLYLHGGGYVLGSAFGYRPLVGALAVAAGAGALVPDYRLAPEHPFPAALDDAIAAYRWLLDRGVDAGRVVVGGCSSGGGLTMSLLLALKERDLPLPGAAILFCPFVDMSQDIEENEVGRQAADAYLAGHPADDPLVAPLRADLSGLPPLLVQAATGDRWLADAKALATRARRQGVDALLELYSIDAHVFQYFWPFLPEASEAIEAAGRFARELETARQTRSA
jgi:epsilon-lactone hydrolase